MLFLPLHYRVLLYLVICSENNWNHEFQHYISYFKVSFQAIHTCLKLHNTTSGSIITFEDDFLIFGFFTSYFGNGVPHLYFFSFRSHSRAGLLSAGPKQSLGKGGDLYHSYRIHAQFFLKYCFYCIYRWSCYPNYKTWQMILSG